MTTPSAWEKLKSVSALIASVLVPLAVTLVGGWHSRAIAENELRPRYLELAIQILTKSPAGQDPEIRGWAADLLASESPTPIDSAGIRALKRAPIDRVNQFLEERWAPEFLKTFYSSPEVQRQFDIAAADNSTTARRDFLVDVTVVAMREIEAKRASMLGQSSADSIARNP